jgi:hypothetical protein
MAKGWFLLVPSDVELPVVFISLSFIAFLSRKEEDILKMHTSLTGHQSPTLQCCIVASIAGHLICTITPASVIVDGMIAASRANILAFEPWHVCA